MTQESTTGQRRGAGRPVKPVLNREMIAEAALELVASQGAETLTMARLSQHLQVSASALYNHITGKTELTLLLQDAVMSRVETAGLSELAEGRGDTREALGEWGRSYRQVFAGYPSLIPLIATMPVAGAPATREMYDVVAAGLHGAGVPLDQVVSVIIAFESFLFGSAMDVHAPADIFQSSPDESDAPVFQRAVDAFTYDGEQRSVEEAFSGESGVLRRNPYANAPFEWGLTALIEQTLRLIDEKPAAQ